MHPLPAPTPQASSPHSPTAWLTGLRGLAALVVAFTHFIAGELETGFRGFFASPPEENRRFYQLFPFRIIFADQAMVALFFIVSAYSISIGPIKRRRNGNGVDKTDFVKGLARSLVRRPIRLYFPVLVLEIISHIIFVLGLYDNTALYWEGVRTIPDTVLHFVSYMLEAVWPFTRETNFPLGLNIQIWTIPAEFRGSLVVFGMLLATAGMSNRGRLVSVVGAAVLAFWHVDWVLFTFLMGLANAEVRDLVDNPRSLKEDTEGAEADAFDTLPPYVPTSSSLHTLTSYLHRVRALANFLLCLVGLYLLTIPEQPASSPWASTDYAILSPLTPTDPSSYPRISQLLRSVGGVLFVFTISTSPNLQRPFVTKPVQYLGKISFGLYLVHVLIYKLARDDLIRFFWWIRGADDASGWVGAAVVLGPVVWGCSHVFWKWVDVRAVEVAGWVDRRVSSG